ncbi:unnamed protein product [Triticum turgidum subsp. durum]|uniref:Glycosyltransferase n=1 Tax=Triticum turgidum subsp. durum TaxID=4567 RepID=A0A9R0UZF1_TRITD|nr:unnamed protein product [Triticum turgidum subsp. durum]
MAMEAAAAGAGGLEVVVFPWLAFGHMIPFLELSKRLAARGHTVSFVSTPRNLARPPVRPPASGSTSDLSPDKVGLLKKAMDGLAGPLAAFLAAAQGGIRHVPDFPASQAALSVFLGPRWANAAHPRMEPEHFAETPRWIPFPSTTFFLRHEAQWVTDAFRTNASGVSDMDRWWQVLERSRLTIHRSFFLERIIHRSCEELEPRMFGLLSDLFRKPAVPAGILLPGAPGDLEEDHRQSSSGSIVRPQVLRWLDDQLPNSVIFVALGSEAPLTPENAHELALGLELAGVHFLWALRKPAGTSNDDELLLPAGFEERTRHRGVVCTGWVPQVEALAHCATGTFLTHCGWGSTIESLSSGIPLVMLPFVVDQPLIARAMVERGIGVEVARDENDGSFDRDGVAVAVRRVMVEEHGKVLATNAKKLQGVLVDQGRQEHYIDEVEA